MTVRAAAGWHGQHLQKGCQQGISRIKQAAWRCNLSAACETPTTQCITHHPTSPMPTSCTCALPGSCHHRCCKLPGVEGCDRLVSRLRHRQRRHPQRSQHWLLQQGLHKDVVLHLPLKRSRLPGSEGCCHAAPAAAKEVRVTVCGEGAERPRQRFTTAAGRQQEARRARRA